MLRQVLLCLPRTINERGGVLQTSECVLPGTRKTYDSRAPALPQGSARISLHCAQPHWASQARSVQNVSKWCLQVYSVSTELVAGGEQARVAMPVCPPHGVRGGACVEMA